jgi:hypothetical protein
MAALLSMTGVLAKDGLFAICVLLPQVEKVAPFLNEAVHRGTLVDVQIEWGHTRPATEYLDTALVLARRGEAPVSSMQCDENPARRVMGLPPSSQDDVVETVPAAAPAPDCVQEAARTGWQIAVDRDRAIPAEGPPQVQGLNRAVGLMMAADLLLGISQGAPSAASHLVRLVNESKNPGVNFFANAAALNKRVLTSVRPEFLSTLASQCAS